MKLAVIGGRTFLDYPLLCSVLGKVKTPITAIVSGGAPGADTLAKRYADEHNIELIEHPAEWEKYGKRAGFMRNQLIVDDCNGVVAFWDGLSKGTLSSLEIAEKQGKPIHIQHYVPMVNPGSHYQRVRIDNLGRRYLQCHSKGASEYSPFNCIVEAFGYMRSIEDHYQCTKVFLNEEGLPVRPRYWNEAKNWQKDGFHVLLGFSIEKDNIQLGDSNTEVTDLVIQYYIALWHKFLRQNPELIEAAQGYDGYEDIFEGKFPFSQAKVIAKCVRDGIESLYPMYEDFRKLIKEKTS